MTTRTDIMGIIGNGKNSCVEFKREGITHINLAKELVAFINSYGGMVLLGVDDDGTMSGFNMPDLEYWVMNLCSKNIRPPIRPDFEIFSEIKAGVDIAIVRVPAGVDMHSVWHKNASRYYVRMGSRTQEHSFQDLNRLFRHRKMPRAELQPVLMASIEDLDFRRLTEYFQRIREQDVPDKYDAEGWNALLVNTKLMSGNYPTVAGMLLFGSAPKKFLPHSGIDAAAFSGHEKDCAPIERVSLRGPMAPLASPSGELVESGLVEQAIEFVERNTRDRARFEDGAHQTETHVYPEHAVREVILNSLIHRDYSIKHSEVKLSIFEDRMEIISPGGPPNGVSTEGAWVGARSARNELLKDTMRDYRNPEFKGFGIPRKIVQSMKQHNGTDPKLMVRGEQFVVELFASS